MDLRKYGEKQALNGSKGGEKAILVVQTAQTGAVLVGETDKTTKPQKTSKNFAKGVDKRGER